MKTTIHHQNFSTNNVEEMAAFYKKVLGLEESKEISGERITDQGYGGDTRFLLAGGDYQIHIATMDLFNGHKTGHYVNPLVNGHLAFRVDDIEELKGRLDKHNVPYSDFGEWSIKGWYQIFLYDPDGNVIEVQQVDAEPEDHQMDIQLHHRNFSTNKVGEMTTFYRDALGLTENKDMHGGRILKQYDGETRFLVDENGNQIHISKKDLLNGHKTGHYVNPLVNGHLAFRVNDIEPIKERLKENNVAFSDMGEWSIEGWYQIFLFDPDGNVLELQQVNE
ncbi:VOC family protein [Oceanobacillus sp. CF4.6]|uniref:VOC family protein n=1 Tax=Oceanobacillus sp. CF4.6 TaxID=3373080 RepID=UPI003EE467F0